MKKNIIRLTVYLLLFIASMIGFIANLITVINYDSAINSAWEKYQSITIMVVFVLLFCLSVLFIVQEIKRLVSSKEN